MITSKGFHERALVGRFDCTLDESRRFLIPTEWLAMAGEGKSVYVMPDPKERCLLLIFACSMELCMARIRESAPQNASTYRALRTIGKLTELHVIDSEGGIRISDKLLDFAGITRRLMIVGGEWYARMWREEESR